MQKEVLDFQQPVACWTIQNRLHNLDLKTLYKTLGHGVLPGIEYYRVDNQEIWRLDYQNFWKVNC